MESSRCITRVENELKKFGLHYKAVLLGKVELKENFSREKLNLIDMGLRNAGLEIMEDRKIILIED